MGERGLVVVLGTRGRRLKGRFALIRTRFAGKK
jgi:hypothetical protein